MSLKIRDIVIYIEGSCQMLYVGLTIIFAVIAYLLYILNQNVVMLFKKINELATSHNSLADRIYGNTAETLEYDRILYLEAGRIYFNVEKLIHKNNTPIQPTSDNLGEGALDLGKIRFYGPKESFEILTGDDEASREYLMISNSIYRFGIVYLAEKPDVFYQPATVEKCMKYYALMLAVPARSILIEANRHKDNLHSSNVTYSLGDLINMSNVSQELLLYYLSYKVRPNIVIFYRQFMKHADYYDVRKILQAGLNLDIYVLKMIMTIASIRYGISLPMNYFNVSEQAYLILEGKISLNSNLRVVK